ncbi:TetR/AcrR family transcriptional regulator [Nocardia sp. NPDC057272]|uniref:TetR/AcrR family transcriptional regulator n=1 Tax=Nocardia sp. NPDC057272 TaxID=3346079 RepID=UPI00363B6197
MPHIPADQRREDLVAAAFRVMARDGVAAASTRAICTEAGVAQSVFHYCFRSKEELLRDLTRTVVEKMVTASTTAFTPGEDLERSLAHIFENLLRTAMDAPERQLVLYELTTTVLRDPKLRDLARWQYDQYYEATGTYLTELATELDFEWTLPAPVLARTFTTMIDGLILNWLADHDTDQAHAVLRTFATLLTGLAAVPTLSGKRPEIA